MKLGLLLLIGLSHLLAVQSAKTLNVEKHMSKLAEANVKFSINLYQQLAKSESNIMFSPISISAAMAMTNLGAKGNTAKQIDDAFMFSGIEDGKFHSAFGELHGLMFETKSDNVTIKFSNRVFAGQNVGVLQDYKNALTVYGAEVNEMNFANPEASADKINKWVQDTTERKIAHIIASSDIKPNLAMILANTIYFKGEWHSQFIESHTEKRDFFVSNYKVVETPFMFQRGKFRYGYVPSLTLQILEMDYAGKDFSMFILLPENFDLAAVEKQLTYENLTIWLSSLQYQDVDLSLPKFKLEESLELHNILPSMGVTDVFTPGKANLSGISKKVADLHVDQVLHKAVLEVDEKGSEAAAATSVRVLMRSIQIRPRFSADRPFLWAIRHRPSNHILFMGRLSRPLGEIKSVKRDEF